MICRRTQVLPVEVIVRGYVAGSGWKDYRRTGSICGHRLPAGLRESDRLPEPILTPSTKADAGTHDENIDLDAMIDRMAGLAVDDRPLVRPPPASWPSRSARRRSPSMATARRSPREPASSWPTRNSSSACGPPASSCSSTRC
jgi:hypothetical protein